MHVWILISHCVNTFCVHAIIIILSFILNYFQASSAGARGDYDTAKSNSNASIGCSITGGVSSVVGIAILIGIAFSGS